MTARVSPPGQCSTAGFASRRNPQGNLAPWGQRSPYPVRILDERERSNVMAEKIAILGGNRIPFARSNGPYAEASNQDMLTTALDGLVARFALQGERAGEVVAGAVLKHSRDFNLTRECVLGSALEHSPPAYAP